MTPKQYLATHERTAKLKSVDIRPGQLNRVRFKMSEGGATNFETGASSIFRRRGVASQVLTSGLRNVSMRCADDARFAD